LFKPPTPNSMKKIFISFHLLFIAVLCSAQTYSFMYQGVSRSYIVHLPTGYVQGQVLPVVLNFHGYTSTAAQQQSYTQFNPIADTAKFIVVYPQGISNSWNAGIGLVTTTDDVGFTSALIDTLHQKFNVNLYRVYATGFSNGGFMDHRLACQLSNRIAAIASVSGTIGTYTSYYTCTPTRKVPVMHIHGTADSTVYYIGSSWSTSVDSTIHFWVDNNTCPTTPVITVLPNTSTSDGSTVTKYYYGLCADSSEVVLLKVIGASHSWPGASGLSGTNMDIKASGEIWNFFRKHHLPYSPTSADEPNSEMITQAVEIMPNPFSEKIVLKINSPEITEIAIYTILGEKVYESNNKNDLSAASFLEISSSKFMNGAYLLQVKTATTFFNYKMIKL
jgi:polyhydroxybutyrate depolymerase